MKSKWLLAVVLLAGLSVQAQKTHPAASPSVAAGRFQFISAVVDAGIGMGGGVTNELFLLDTQTGRVWRYQAGGMEIGRDGARTGVPELFVTVGFMGDETAAKPPVKNVKGQ